MYNYFVHMVVHSSQPLKPNHLLKAGYVLVHCTGTDSCMVHMASIENPYRNESGICGRIRTIRTGSDFALYCKQTLNDIKRISTFSVVKIYKNCDEYLL